jgi:hypothetical protein
MFEGMRAAFDDARAEDSVVPIHLFYREWAIVRAAHQAVAGG